MAKLVQTAKEHLLAAQATVGKLLQDDPDNREFLALKARCLLVDLPQGLLEGGGRRDRTRDAATVAQRQEGVVILRDLVEKNPEAEQLRLELCKALIEDRRRDGPPRGRRGDLTGRDRPAPSEEELQVVREAKVHADYLLGQEPLSPEYKALRAEVGTLLARMLRDRSEQPGEAARAELLRQATEELVAVIEVERGLIRDGEALDPRFFGRILDSRLQLAAIHFAAGRTPEGVEQMRAVADLLEGQLAVWKSDGMVRPSSRLFAGQLENGRVARIEEILRNAGEVELLARLRAVREQLLGPPSERPDRPDRQDRSDRQGPPPEPRRGGK
ncbi:MAG: hypothetical protein IT456_19355 [Planctomycetes bacterium]|nr:hypothetical protein [Planctomycetota bacterium]